MNESANNWIAALATLANASFSGVFVASMFRWSPAALSAGIPLSVALGLGPFMLGLFSIVALGFFRGHDSVVHVFVIHVPLAILALWGARRAGLLTPSRLNAERS